MTIPIGKQKQVFSNRLESAEKLATYRKTMGMNQELAAKLLGVSQPKYCNMEYGRSTATEHQVGLMRERFIFWRQLEIIGLSARINLLNQIQ